MRAKDIIAILERIAPVGLAEPEDSIGLQVGDPNAEVRSVAVALDPLPAIIRRAAGAELLVSHHPIIRRPLSGIDFASMEGDAIRAAIKSDLTVYVMHTNYDAAPGGVSDAMAAVLGVSETEPLARSAGDKRFKIAVFVPEEAVFTVRDAMAEAGAGIIGEYSHCSFRTQGIGTFLPLAGASPYVGRVGHIEEVAEWRLEMLVAESRRDAVVAAMIAAHPYEEVAYDIYELANPPSGSGMGRVGRIEPTAASDLLQLVRDKLRAPDSRYFGPDDAVFERIAVCGGSGGRLIPEAARAGAQAYVTGDVGYHARLLAAHLGLAVIDAGHRETEMPGVRRLAASLRALLKAENIHVRLIT